MNKLWIFGDSFSNNFTLTNNENVKRYLEIIQKTEIKYWPQILAEKFNFELVNYAKGGNSNYQIFQDFCDSCHLIKENDIVIIGWGLIEKFRISENNTFLNIHPSNTRSFFNMSKETLDAVIENRKVIHLRCSDNKIIDRWAWEIYTWQTAMNTLSKNRRFKLFFWSTEEPRLIYNESEECKNSRNYLCSESNKPLMNYLKDLGCLSMMDETNGMVGDSHFGILGHEKQAEIFYNEIINKNFYE